MCELLVFAVNNTHADPGKDRRGCYKRGMIVVVQTDGHVWGLEESKQAWIAAGMDVAAWHDKFVIVKIPGVSVAAAQEAISHQTEDDSGTPLFEAGGTTPKIFRRRRWKLLVNTLPSAILNALQTDGEVTVTASQVRNYLKRVRDNAVYSGF